MGNITYEKWAWIWLDGKRSSIKKSSAATYSVLLENYLVPTFGQMNLTDITPSVIQTAVDYWVSETNLGATTIRSLLRLLTASCKSAAPYYEIRPVALRDIRLGKPVANCQKALTLQEQNVLRDYIYSVASPKALATGLALGSGLRIGEACGAAWKDVDKHRQTISIRRTVQRIVEKSRDSVTTEVIVGTPKTLSSIREVPIPDWLFKLLLEHEEAPSSFIASGKEQYIEPRTLRVWYTRAAQTLGLNPAVPFHGLRHSFATRCIASGMDAKAVSEILGHGNVKTTLDLYTHPSMEYKLEGVNAAFNQ